jgi:hypothetical protein
MRPALPDPPYTVTWGGTAESNFGGQILNGGIGTLRVPPGPAAQGEVAAELLRRGALLGVFAVMGPLTESVAPLITVFDAAGVEVAMLGVDRSDLVYRGRTRASEWGLTDPVIRVAGVLDSLAVGDTARLATLYTVLGRCFDVATNRYCRVGFTGASGWALLRDIRFERQGSYARFDAVWLALLILPAGFWAGPKLAGLIFMALAWYGMFRLPIDAHVHPVTVVALIGLAVGLILGMTLGELQRRRAESRNSGAVGPAPPAPDPSANPEG